MNPFVADQLRLISDASFNHISIAGTVIVLTIFMCCGILAGATVLWEKINDYYVKK